MHKGERWFGWIGCLQPRERCRADVRGVAFLPRLDGRITEPELRELIIVVIETLRESGLPCDGQATHKSAGLIARLVQNLGPSVLDFVRQTDSRRSAARPCVVGSFPLSIDACAGRVIGIGLRAASKTTPSAASRSMFGVRARA